MSPLCGRFISCRIRKIGGLGTFMQQQIFLICPPRGQILVLTLGKGARALAGGEQTGKRYHLPPSLPPGIILTFVPVLIFAPLPPSVSSA